MALHSPPGGRGGIGAGFETFRPGTIGSRPSDGGGGGGNENSRAPGISCPSRGRDGGGSAAAGDGAIDAGGRGGVSEGGDGGLNIGGNS